MERRSAHKVCFARALLVAAWFWPAVASGGSSRTFTVGVEVRPRRALVTGAAVGKTPDGAPGGTAAALFVGPRGETATACGSTRDSCTALARAGATVGDAAVVVTLVPDGAPAAIVER